jgi:hypothetical protein
MMETNELYAAFGDIRRIGTTIKPRSEFDSIVVTCTTQFEFVFETGGPNAVIALCSRIVDHLVLAGSGDRRDLLHLVRHVGRDMERRLA